MTTYRRGENQTEGSTLYKVHYLTKYKYHISVQMIQQQKTKIDIQGILEVFAVQSKSDIYDDKPWIDISQKNAQQVRRIEYWLYEQIENRLYSS